MLKSVRDLWSLSVDHLWAAACRRVWKSSCRLQPCYLWRVWSQVLLKIKFLLGVRKIKCSTESPDLNCLGFSLKIKGFFRQLQKWQLLLNGSVNQGSEKIVPYCVLPLDKQWIQTLCVTLQHAGVISKCFSFALFELVSEAGWVIWHSRWFWMLIQPLEAPVGQTTKTYLWIWRCG